MTERVSLPVSCNAARPDGDVRVLAGASFYQDSVPSGYLLQSLEDRLPFGCGQRDDG
jgi:hypothetical protein